MRYIPVLVFRNLPRRITAMDKLFPVIPMIIRIKATTNIVIIIVESTAGSLSALCSQFNAEQLQSKKSNPINLSQRQSDLFDIETTVLDKLRDKDYQSNNVSLFFIIAAHYWNSCKITCLERNNNYSRYESERFYR